MTYYNNYSQLRKCEKEGADYQIRFQERGSGILIMAPHGGCIEPGTTEIAHEAAGKEHSIYCFEGIKDRDNTSLHITSTHFDEPIGLKLAGKARSILALHGCRDDEPIIYLGGKDEILQEEIRKSLEEIKIRVGKNPRFPGRHPNNICNRSLRGEGVQMEISLALRRLMFVDLKRDQREPRGELFHNIVLAIRKAMTNYLVSVQEIVSNTISLNHARP